MKSKKYPFSQAPSLAYLKFGFLSACGIFAVERPIFTNDGEEGCYLHDDALRTAYWKCGRVPLLVELRPYNLCCVQSSDLK